MNTDLNDRDDNISEPTGEPEELVDHLSDGEIDQGSAVSSEVSSKRSRDEADVNCDQTPAIKKMAANARVILAQRSAAKVFTPSGYNTSRSLNFPMDDPEEVDNMLYLWKTNYSSVLGKDEVPPEPTWLELYTNDENAALSFADEVKKAFAVNLAKNVKVTATNVRNNDKKYGALNVLDENKNTYWSTDDNVTTSSLTINFGKATTFNRFLVQEYIRLGQRVQSFSIEALVDGSWKEVAKATTIGYKRILRFPTITATKLRFNIIAAKACPLISNIGVYNAPQILAAPTIIRNQSGEISITPADAESQLFYTTNGTLPTTQSKKYSAPFLTDGKVEIRAIAFDPASKKTSNITHEKFGIVRKNWKIMGISDEKVNAIIDGNSSTAWHHDNNIKLPAELTIDLGKEENLVGFKYLPDQSLWGGGLISQYQFFVSANGVDWKLMSEGEFSNIKNNPLWQTKMITDTKTRYIKLRALKNADNNNNIGYAELDIITK